MPPGSIQGLVLFNVLTNIIFYFIKNCKLYNYTDDTTVSNADNNLKRLIEKNVEDSL